MMKHRLAGGGETDYVIIVDPSADVCEQFAARQLADYLERISGAVFRVTAPEYIDGHFPIIVGFNKLSAFFDTPRDAALGEEGFIIRSVDCGLIIAGAEPRGTLYGVYAFLEKIGVRFLAFDETVVPMEETLVCPALDIREKPAFMYRYGFYRMMLGDVGIKNRLNGAPAGALHGGSAVPYIAGAGHSFFALVPPDQYFAEHPEYYSEIDGVRVPNKQLCLTNESVYQIIYETLYKRLEEHPENRIQSVSINDCGGYCTCERCRAVDEKYESHMGSLLVLLNRLAEELEKDFPDVIIGTLAYLHTRKPPAGLSARKNVCIWLCSIECCFAHPITECGDVYGPRKGTLAFPDDLHGWKEAADLLFVWDYVNNFGQVVQPHPNLRVLQKNIQFFRDSGVKGVFEQGHTGVSNGTPDLNELRYYLIAKLLWNPDCDIEAHKREFLDGYYGPAADAVAEYIKVFEDRVDSGNIHFGISNPPACELFDSATLERAKAALDSGSALVKGQKKYENRIERLYLTLEYPRFAMRVSDGKATREEINVFCNRVIKSGYDHLEESMDIEKRRKYCLEMGRLPDLVNGEWRGLAGQ